MHYLFPLFFFLGALVFSLSTASMCFTGRPYSSAVRVHVDGRKEVGGGGMIPCGDCGCMCLVYNGKYSCSATTWAPQSTIRLYTVETLHH